MVDWVIWIVWTPIMGYCLWSIVEEQLRINIEIGMKLGKIDRSTRKNFKTSSPKGIIS